MATIKFYLRSATPKSNIQVRLSISRTEKFRTSTNLVINSNDWSDKTDMPIQKNPENKLLHTQLKDLSNFILKQYNNDFQQGISFSTEWLKNTIKKHFGRKTEPEGKENDDLFSVYLK